MGNYRNEDIMIILWEAHFNQKWHQNEYNILICIQKFNCFKYYLIENYVQVKFYDRKRNCFNTSVFIMEIMFKLENNGSNECYYFLNSDNTESCKENIFYNPTTINILSNVSVYYIAILYIKMRLYYIYYFIIWVFKKI